MSDQFTALVVELIRFVPKLLSGIVTLLVALVVSSLAAKAVARRFEKRQRAAETQRLAQRLVRWSIVTLGIVAALDQVDFNVSSFLAGIGIIGFTVGFALQDIARNFVAGMLLLMRQPFRIGDAVEIAGITGKVLDINARDTVLRTWTGQEVVVPNIDVFGGSIKRLNPGGPLRRNIEIGLGYGQDATRAMSVFLDTISSLDGVLSEPAPAIYAQTLGASTLNLTLFFWVDPAESSLFVVHSNAVLALDAAARAHGIDLPYPIQQVQLMDDGLRALALSEES